MRYFAAVSPAILLHHLGDLALRIARTLGVSFVMLLLAFGQADFAFDAPALVMQIQWHQCVA